MELWEAKQVLLDRQHANRDRALTLRTDKYAPTEYNQFFAWQNGKCAGCEEEPEGKMTKYYDVVAGKVTGLICHRCKLILQRVEHSKVRLESLARFLC